ncbi:heterokaryon incompatibility protein-domain-containing protein [Xylariaceae sp. FL0255]|nr:heterokaryon incompatibility protein-domain-containing protein [Xylariaceae sp. FL0255]
MASALLDGIENSSTQKGDKQSIPCNPQLCQDCQTWNTPVLGYPHFHVDKNRPDYKRPDYGPHRDDVLLKQLSCNVECLVCQALTSAIHCHIRSTPRISDWEKSSISVHRKGPLLPYGSTSLYLRAPVLRVLVDLELSLTSDNRSSTQGTTKTKSMRSALAPQFLLYYSQADGRCLLGIEPFRLPFFDIKTLHRWLHTCESTHPGSCNGRRERDQKPWWPGKGLSMKQLENPEQPRHFRVIDTRSLRIVMPRGQVDYAALSYMWQPGKTDHIELRRDNLEQLQATNGLASVSIPRIIQGAVFLCQKLGQRYLWVDRLCIVQDDTKSKHDQIRGMDQIYSRARFTIVAALNDKNDLGLPGIYGCPRNSAWTATHRYNVEGNVFKSNGTDRVVDGCLWDRRGWTFQERILSKRRVYISDSHVIYECPSGQVSEEQSVEAALRTRAEIFYRKLNGRSLRASWSIFMNRVRDHSIALQADDPASETIEDASYDRSIVELRSKLHTYATPESSSMTIIKYFRCIENYTARQFSFESDILNAFSGVSNAASRQMGTRMAFSHPESALAQSLLWKSTSTTATRTEPPGLRSWCWASSAQPIYYHWRLETQAGEEIEEICSLVYFHMQDPELGLRKIHTEERWMDNVQPITETGSSRELPRTFKEKYRPSPQRTYATWLACPHNPSETLAHTVLDQEACHAARAFPRSLVFNTTVASLRPRVRKGPAGHTHVVLETGSGQEVGALPGVSGEWKEEHKNDDRFYEFIILCGGLETFQTRKQMVWDHDDYNSWLLYAVMVESVPDHPHVVRRLEIGTVKAHLWKDCNHRWETIVLS